MQTLAKVKGPPEREETSEGGPRHTNRDNWANSDKLEVSEASFLEPENQRTMTDLSLFTNSFAGIAILALTIFLTLAAILMPLYVISIHTMIKRRSREQKLADEQQARLLNQLIVEVQRRK